MFLICSENFTSNPNEAYCHDEFINIWSSFLSSFTNKEMLEGNETDYYLNLGTFINPGGGGSDTHEDGAGDVR